MKKIRYIFIFIFLFSVGFFLGFLFLLPNIYKSKEVKVPNVIGLSLNDGINIIKDNDLKYNIIYENSTEEEGLILDYSPKMDYLKENSYLNIKVSKGKKENRMPNLLNKSLDEVDSILKQNNITYDVIYEDNKNSDNIVLNQIPLENDIINDNTKVYLVLSRSNNYINIPNMKNWDIDKVVNFENENNIYFEYEYVNSSFVDENKVISQSIDPNTKWLKNNMSYIKLTISKGNEYVRMPDFNGLDIYSASILAESLNIELEVIYKLSNEENDIVISQSVDPGILIEKDNKMIVIVSKGG